MKDHIISTMEDLEERRIYLCRLRFSQSQDDDEQTTLYKRAYEGALAEMQRVQLCDPDDKGYTGEWQMQFTAPDNNWTMFTNTGEMWMSSNDVELLDNRLIYDLLDDISEMGLRYAYDDVLQARAHYMLKDVIGDNNVVALLREACKWTDVTYAEQGD